MGKYKLVGNGGHTLRSGRTLKTGDVLVTKRDMTKFKGKFERIDLPKEEASEEVVEDPLEVDEESDTAVASSDGKTNKTPEATPPLGKDVTEEFPLATDNGYRVFRAGKVCFVTNSKDTAKALNEEPLKRTEVVNFITKLIDSDE